jgi:hypothetical protein
MDEIRQLWHGGWLQPAVWQTAGMPLQFKVIVTLVVIGCLVFLANGIRTLRRRKRNLEHWEKGEPLEGVDDW